MTTPPRSTDPRMPARATATSSRDGITLVLGGGGFKGLAHVGVLQAFEEQHVPVRSLVGTSAGAIMGAGYAHLGSAAELREAVLGFVRSDVFLRKAFVGFNKRASRNGMGAFMARVVSGIKRQVALERMFRRSSAFGGAALRFVVKALVPDVHVQDLALPLAISALDLVKGEEVLITDGPLHSAVCASSSVPGFFPPVEREGRVLVDPGIVNNLPTARARGLGSLHIVAVDLSQGLASMGAVPVGMDMLLRAQEISTRIANRRKGEQADVVIAPELGSRSWLDASAPEDVIAAGHAATLARMPEIKAMLAGPRQPA